MACADATACGSLGGVCRGCSWADGAASATSVADGAFWTERSTAGADARRRQIYEPADACAVRGAGGALDPELRCTVEFCDCGGDGRRGARGWMARSARRVGGAAP